MVELQAQNSATFAFPNPMDCGVETCYLGIIQEVVGPSPTSGYTFLTTSTIPNHNKGDDYGVD